MSLLGWIAVAAIGGLISDAHEKSKKRAEEEKKRKNTPCQYDGNISQYDFEQIVLQAVRKLL